MILITFQMYQKSLNIEKELNNFPWTAKLELSKLIRILLSE